MNLSLCQKEKYPLINNLPSSLRVCASKGCTALPINKDDSWVTPHVAFECACVYVCAKQANNLLK